eukprot:2943515-Amphidinium_carterae.1
MDPTTTTTTGDQTQEGAGRAATRTKERVLDSQRQSQIEKPRTSIPQRTKRIQQRQQQQQRRHNSNDNDNNRGK